MKNLHYKLLSVLLIIGLIFKLSSCGNSNNLTNNNESSINISQNQGEQESEQLEEKIMFIKIGDNTLTANLVDNSSTRALLELLENGDITINMRDYANFEKVGSLGTNLPRNDEYFTTQAGDLILYQGNQFVIYYDTNSYSFTRLGKIQNVSQQELKDLLGSGSVTITLSLTN